MLPGSLAFSVALQLAGTVGVAPVEIVGFDDKDLPAAVAAVDKAVKDTGHDTVAGPAIDEACGADGTCVASRLEGTSLSHLVRLSAFRVGSDVEVQDTLYDQGGAVLATGKRVITVDGFLQAPLSSEVSAVLVSTAPPADATTTTTTTTTTTSGPPAIGALPPGAFVAAGGGLVALVGLVGFGLEAATLDNPQSAGADKERARTTGWLFLGLTAVGIGAAAGGAVWALLPDETAAPAPAPAPAATTSPAPAETPPAASDAAILDG